MNGHSDIVSFLWSVAELLRGDYKAADYGKVILPFTVLRRLDCLLEPTKDAVLKAARTLPAAADPAMREALLNRAAGEGFHNAARFTFALLRADPAGIEANLRAYLNGFSANIQDIFVSHFDLPNQVARLERSNLLYLIVQKFAEIDLHPERVSNLAMGTIFEELIRRFSEASNETAGEHFTPREVIRLMVNLLLTEDTEALAQRGVIRTLYDPACGTGGMLSVAEDYLRELNPAAKLVAFGQELNPESYAICKSDLLIKGQDPGGIAFGNSFTEDGHAGKSFDYCLSNPPFGVDWKKVEREISEEHKKCGFTGCFGAGLPRASDKSPLFVQYMNSKFHKDGRPLRLPWRRGREAEVGTVATHRVHDDRERARHLGGRSLVAALPGRRQFPTSSGWMPFTHSPSPSSSYNFRYSQADRFSTAVWNALSRFSDQTCPSLACCQTCTWSPSSNDPCSREAYS